MYCERPAGLLKGWRGRLINLAPGDTDDLTDFERAKNQGSR
jgi:hypothetical protein